MSMVLTLPWHQFEIIQQNSSIFPCYFPLKTKIPSDLWRNREYSNTTNMYQHVHTYVSKYYIHAHINDGMRYERFACRYTHDLGYHL